jgi:Arc/MetJ-type ribon-helix-helix transcriptional regulator
MPKICYERKNFGPGALARIFQANEILNEYAAQGFDLTLRQLYYQFVARGFIPNKDTEYKRLGELVNDARMAGLIDWDRITDRTRNLRELNHWDSPSQILDDVAAQYRSPKWKSQPNYVEVWIEKDALVGVVQQAADAVDVPYFSCRGYTSQSEMWTAAMRLLEQVKAGKQVTIIHLGDHDPSGIDMTRDIRDRLSGFIAHHYPSGVGRFVVDRIALTMDQIRQYNPPPNPAKITDSRAAGYIAEYGDESWELDALPPDAMSTLIREAVVALLDREAWDRALESETAERESLGKLSRHWDEASEFLESI